MRVLITGAAGFIGANFVRHCRQVSPDWDLVGLDDLSTGRESNLLGLELDLRVDSLADQAAVRAAARGVDAVVHLGALGSVPRSIKDPLASHTANLTGTLNVMEAARGEGAYVTYASSSSVYGANLKLPKSEFDWTRPLSPYAVTKLGAEAYVLAYQKAYGLRTLAFRFFNVYGPLQAADHVYAAVIPRFVDAGLRGEALTVHGDGLQSRDFTHVDSVCSALHTAVRKKVSVVDPINLAFGTNTTLLELIDLLREAMDLDLTIEFVEPRAGDVRASQSDGIRIREYFPETSPINLAEGLASTVNWFRSRRVQAG